MSNEYETLIIITQKAIKVPHFLRFLEVGREMCYSPRSLVIKCTVSPNNNVIYFVK